MNSTLRIADLFAGLGGLSYPFEEYNAEVVFWSEKDLNAQKYKQVGNSVPVPVIKAVAKSLVNYLVNVR